MPSLTRIPVLLAALAITLAPRAQTNRSALDNIEAPQQRDAEAPWTSANPRRGFDKVVRIHFTENHPNSYGFVGRGNAIVAGPQQVTFPFHYYCGRTFHGGDAIAYPARWLKGNRKLQILIGDPDSDRTQKCTLSANRHG